MKVLLIGTLLYAAYALGAAVTYKRAKKAQAKKARQREEKEKQRARENDGWRSTFFEYRMAKRRVPCESPSCPACSMRNEMLHRDAVRHSPNN